MAKRESAMTQKMLLFDYRYVEDKFFENHTFNNFEISFYTQSLTPEVVKTLPDEILETTTIISVFIDSEVTDEVINAFKNLRIISTRSTGYDHINLTAAKNKNIAVMNVENYGETSVAQYAFGLVIGLIRNFFPAILDMKNIRKRDYNPYGRDLSKLSIGIVGTGSIGGAMCKMAKCFNMEVFAYDINKKRELAEIGVNYVSLEELLEKSDIVSLHLPYTGNNYHMFSDREFEKMKEGAYFINTSRGEIIDISALYKQLENEHLGGAALDVLECIDRNYKCKNISDEPLICEKELYYVRKLADFDNVLITPHIAYATQDAVDYILKTSIKSINDFLAGEKISRVV